MRNRLYSVSVFLVMCSVCIDHQLRTDTFNQMITWQLVCTAVIALEQDLVQS